MKILLPIVVFALFMAYVSQRRSVCKINEYGINQYVFKEKAFWFLMAIGMAIFCGLRLTGNDTGTYRNIYMNIEPGDFNIDWKNISSAPGLTFVCTIFRSIGVSVQDYLMLESIFVILVYLWFIHKHTTNLWLSLFYFIAMGAYTFVFAAIKQTVAVAILLIATDKAIKKRYGVFLILVLIAELFHPYAFVYLIIPFLFFEPWSDRTYAILAGTVLVSVFLSTVIEGIFSMTESLGYEYSADSFTDDGVNAFRVLVVWVPTVLSFWVRSKFKGNLGRIEQLIINASMINAVIMFIGLFGTANYFARLANYFLIFQTLSLPLLIQFFDAKDKKLLRTVSVFMFLLYFYYSVEIAQGSFSNTYKFMGLIEYIKQLFN